MRIAGVKETSLFDGYGINYVIFVQGCKHHCYSCHNPETWNFKGGYEKSVEEIIADIKPYLGFITGITFSGGDPAEQLPEVDRIAEWAKNNRLQTTLYTGYLFETIRALNSDELKYIDYVIDGKYMDSLKSTNYPFRGSSNQRVFKQTKERGWVEQC